MKSAGCFLAFRNISTKILLWPEPTWVPILGKIWRSGLLLFPMGGKFVRCRYNFFNTGLVEMHFLEALEKNEKKMNEMLAGTAG